MSTQRIGGLGLLLAVLAAGAAKADEGPDVRAEIETLKRQLAEQQRTIRRLENSAPTQEEIQAAVGHYLASSPAAVLVGGAEDGGKAGWPKGKKPFIKEGPNKLEIGLRLQVRYEAFLYSDDAVGTTGNGATPEVFSLSDAAPRDRSGFEIERACFDLGGSMLCEQLTYFFQVSFDTDFGTGVEKRYAFIDYEYARHHHVRAGADKVYYGIEEQTSSGALAFVDRGIVMKAFDLGFQTGVYAWGFLPGGGNDKRWFYKVSATNGEGRMDQEGGGPLGTGSVFNRDARDTFSDQLLFNGALEYHLTCPEFRLDEVDQRECGKRDKLLAAVGVAAYYEDDDDGSHQGWGGLALRSTGNAERAGYNAWVRAHWNGWSFQAEWLARTIDWQNGSPEQADSGVYAQLHYRFPNSGWGVGVRAGVIWLDDDYLTVAVNPGQSVDLDDTIAEYGAVVNYFFANHNHKLTADANWVQENSGVSSSSAGYLVDPRRGVVVEDGVMFRIQWQLAF